MKMKEERMRSMIEMKENTKRQNIILGEEKKKRLYQEMEERFHREIETPELERRKQELGILIIYYILAKRRNFFQNQGSIENSIKAKKVKIGESLRENEETYDKPYEQNNMSIVGRIKNNSRKQFKNQWSKHKLVNYNNNRINFDSKNIKSISQNKPYRDSRNQKYYPQGNNINFIDHSVKEENNAGSFEKENQMNQYYHNVKALENVMKEDKDNMKRREREKKSIIQRKQKVASYSKLVREIHWNHEERTKQHFIENKPVNKYLVKGNDHSNQK